MNNNINCDIIRDLLPLYIDELTSEVSNKSINEHLENCTECKEIAHTMDKTIIINNIDTKKEIDYLKKIKTKKTKAIFLSIAICISVFLVALIGFVKYFVIGLPISPSAMEYECIFDEETNELMIMGSFGLAQTEFSGIKVEEDKSLVNTINITVRGAERPWDSKKYNRQFSTTIDIPNNGDDWSVYLIGDSPHDTSEVWTNYYENQDRAVKVLSEYLLEREGFTAEKDILLGNPDMEYELPIMKGYFREWRRKNDLKSEDYQVLMGYYYVNANEESIYKYDESTNSWIEEKHYK